MRYFYVHSFLMFVAMKVSYGREGEEYKTCFGRE